VWLELPLNVTCGEVTEEMGRTGNSELGIFTKTSCGTTHFVKIAQKGRSFEMKTSVSSYL
jgi:hypothetical protein